MEYIDGGDLEKVISHQRGKLMDEADILRYFVQIVSVVSYLHSNHILHRDLKPQNVFLTKMGIVKLGDFGVAKSLNSSCDLAKTVIGTPFYLSPEIWEGSPYDAKSDIWSLGCILFELCSLHKPFEAQNASALLAAVVQGKHGPIPSRYSQSLKDLIEGMLNLAPQLRPSAEQIMELPFIQKAANDLIDRNQKKLQKSPPRNRNKQNKTRPRILFTAQNQSPLKFSPPPSKPKPPKTTTNTKRIPSKTNNAFANKTEKFSPCSEKTVPKWAISTTSSKRVQPTFGGSPAFNEDFISDDDGKPPEVIIEDDFIDDDDEDPSFDEFHILEESTASLRDSLKNSLKRSFDTPQWVYQPSPTSDTDNTIDFTIEHSDPYQIDQLKECIEEDIGSAQFALLYAHVLTENIPQSAKFIKEYELKNKNVVGMVRDLIRLEQKV